MENNSTVPQHNIEEDEIDILALVMRLWEKKWFIVKVTCVFAILGLFVAIFTPEEYTASCVVVPETKGGAFSSSSSLGGLAAIAGINLGASSGGEMLSPNMYNSLLKNINLCKELVQTPLNFQEYDEPITILDYYTLKEYQKFSLKKTLIKYTIGLPGVIIGLFKDKSEEQGIEKNLGESYNLVAFTHRELVASGAIAQNISINADPKSGSVEFSATMPDPIVAAQVVEAVKYLLQKYVIELKLQKAELNYEYIKQRYDEAKVVFERKQKEYAKFQDANKVLSTALSKAKEEQMSSEFNVAKDLFNQLTSQLVQAEMKIKEDIPILTVVEPVQVPLERSRPQSLQILFIWCFIGAVLGCVFIIGGDWLKNQGIENKRLNKIIE